MSEREVFVYVIAVRDGDEIRSPVKIGVSASPKSRMEGLQTACPFDLVLVRQFRFPNREIALGVEDMFHKTQAKHQRRGEWFDLAPSVATSIINLHLCWTLKHIINLDHDDFQAAAEMCGIDRELWDLP